VDVIYKASGSNDRRMSVHTWRIRIVESDRRVLSMSNDFGSAVMKCPRRHDGPGSPVSPGGKTIVVGVSAIRDANGTTSTVSALGDRFLWSSETIRTQ
jgi:hypothetical protein